MAPIPRLPKSFDAWNVPDLKKLAKRFGIKVSTKTRGDLVNELEIYRRAKDIGVLGTFFGGGLDLQKAQDFYSAPDTPEWLKSEMDANRLSLDAAGWLHAYNVPPMESWATVNVSAPDGEWIVTITYDDGSYDIIRLGNDYHTPWRIHDTAKVTFIDVEKGVINTPNSIRKGTE